MKINERWEERKEESNGNIQSKEGILKRQTRSIQTEGHFGDIKENENFRRFCVCKSSLISQSWSDL